MIQVYAPTSGTTEEECEQIYEQLPATMRRIKCGKHENYQHQEILIVKLEKKTQKSEEVLGLYGYGICNERGWKLIEFCQIKNMKVLNSF